MATVAIRDELVAPIERVWACFADFGDLSAERSLVMEKVF